MNNLLKINVFLLCVLPFSILGANTQAPHTVSGKVLFSYTDPAAETVFLAGDFNGWDAKRNPMERDNKGTWTITIPLPVGFHQYKFVVDGEWLPDPSNPAKVMNNYGEFNSTFYLDSEGVVELRTRVADEKAGLEAVGGKGKVYLALVWHQHQPYYLDASRDQLIAPWVRTHTTKDYYDMTAMLVEHPDIHLTVNLTPVLLHQLERWYVERLAPYYDRENNRIRAEAFLDQWEGKTDPWVDLMFTETADFTAEQEDLLYRNEWSCFSISHVIMNRFPEYRALREKPVETFTLQDKRNLKCWFWLANFDPDFLRAPVKLVTGDVVDLSDLVREEPGNIWFQTRPFSEADANRLVAEFYKIAVAVIPVHRALQYDPYTFSGQVELITTPYFHPILPLLDDIHSGKSDEDQAPDSVHFSFPVDAGFQVAKAVEAWRKWFGRSPTGMWPAEGSVSEAALEHFTEQGIQWVATGDGVLHRSRPEGNKADKPYYYQTADGKKINLFFRDTHLSDMIGFRYQRWQPEEAADDLIRLILENAPADKDDSVLLTILLDGENAWEWYVNDPDAKQFLHLFYQKLGEQQALGKIITVTPSEYLLGNPERGITPQAYGNERRLSHLFPGSWIRADFSTWVGEAEENRAWWWLNRVREDVEKTIGSPRWVITETGKTLDYLRVWDAMFAAEGSDWFWWYGDDQNTGSGDSRWDMLFRNHLHQVYKELNLEGFNITPVKIPSLMEGESAESGEDGAMAPGK